MGVSSELLETALRHAQHDRKVFPCDPATKRPLVTHGFRDATLDPASIRAWFDRQRPPMIGMPTGKTTGIVVLDIDPTGHESLADLERQHGTLPPTSSVCTPRSGQHYYFRHPGGDVPCSAGKIATGIDLRGDGGYVICPPSARADGRRYEIDAEVALASMPGWLLGLARGEHTRATGPSGTEPELIPYGRRHAKLVQFCGALRAMGLCEEAIVEMGRAFLVHQCVQEPAIDHRHAERSMRSIARSYPPRPNRAA